MTEQVATDPPVDPALTSPPIDPPADPPVPEPETPPRRMVPEDVFVREITPLRSRIRETETELQHAQRTIREQNELLTRLQQKPGDPAAPHPTPIAPRPAADPAHVTTDVQRAAAELVFARDAQTISETAYKSYGQGWVDSVNLLNSFGLNSGDFVGSVMEVVGRDRTHEVMHAIAQEPERAAALASLSPARRIAEITRISIAMTAKPAAATQADPVKPAAPPARTVSRAPNPPPSVEPSASKVVDWRSDEATDEEFDAGFQEMMKKRSAKR